MKFGPLDESNSVPNLKGLARSLVVSSHGLRTSDPRVTDLLMQALRAGLSTEDLVYFVRSVTHQRSLPAPTRSKASCLRHVVAPFFQHWRNQVPLREFAAKLNHFKPASYNHWERARRDPPLWVFLWHLAQFDPLYLRPFLELVSSTQSSGETFKSFFSSPLVPTVFLSLHMDRFASLTRSKLILTLARELKIPPLQLDVIFDYLQNNQLVEFTPTGVEVQSSNFYALPQCNAEEIQKLHHFWFSKSTELLKNSGFHRIEQHALSSESKQKVLQWIQDLRERIKVEVQTTKSRDNLIHINWQLAELL